MTHKINIVITLILCLFTFILNSNVNASQIMNPNLLEFSLSLQNQTTSLKYSSNTYETQTDYLGINWYEPFSQYFHGGLELGSIEMTQINNPLATATFTSGEYIGLLLRFIPIETDSFSLMLNLNYRYNRTQGESTNQETQFAWNEALFVSELQYYPLRNLGLIFAAEYQVLDGEQQDLGTINPITTFHESEQQNYRFGINFTSNNSGVVGLEWLTGFKTGSRLYFLRKF